MKSKGSGWLVQRVIAGFIASMGVCIAVGFAPEVALGATPAPWSPVGPIVPPTHLAGVAYGGGNVYVATTSGELYELSGGVWQDLGSTGDQLYGITYDNGAVYAAGKHGVYVYQGGSLAPVSGAPSNQNLAILSANGKVYVGDSTVWSYDPTTKKWANLNLSGGAYVQKMAYANGTLYAGLGAASSGSSVWHYNGSTWVNDVSTSGVGPGAGTTGIYVDSSGNVYAAQYNGIYEEQGAGNWSFLPGSPADVYSFSVVNGTLYAGTESGGNAGNVYRDSAGTWSTVTGSPGDSVAYMASDGSTLFVAGSKGLDEYSGVSWSHPGALAPSATYFVYPLSGTLLAGTFGDTWTYDGTKWHDMTNAASVLQAVYTLGGTSYFGARDGVYTNPLDTGTLTPSTSSVSYVSSFAVLNGVLFAGASNGIFEYQSGQWRHVPGTGAYYVTSLAAFKGQLYFSGSTASFIPTSGTWTLTPGGTVTQVAGSIGMDATTLAVDNGVLYAGNQSGYTNIWTYDGTGAWTESTSGPVGVSNLLNIGGALYAIAGTNRDQVYVLSGGNWNLVAVAPFSLNDVAVSGTTMYGATENGIYETTLASGLPGQLPEVPFAGVLPLIAAGGFSLLLWRRSGRRRAR